MRRIYFIGTAAALGFGLAGGLAGCGPDYDMLTRDGVWNPSHINRANLTLTAASPADLVHGSGTTATDGQAAMAAVERYRNDKIKKLPDSGLTQISVNGSGANNSGGGQ